MKICFFGDSGSIHIQRWCKHFSSLGNEVHLITFSSVQIEGTQVYSVLNSKIAVEGGNWKVLFKFRHVRRLLKEIKPDVFHAFYATSYGITGALVNYHPYIITSLGTDVLISPKNSFIYRTLLRFAFRRADLVTAMSEQMNKAVRELGVGDRKVITLPFGIDPGVFNNSDRKLKEDAFVVTHTRNFESIYNIPHFIRAIALIADEVKGLHINMVGAGSLEGEMKQLVKDNGLESYFHFHGKITQTEIAEMLRSSHVFVSVSLSDGNNISLNEAMACGTYPIVSDIEANRQWIDDGVNGRLIEIDDDRALSDAILEAYTHYPELSARATALSEERIQAFGLWPENMKRMVMQYEQLVK